MGEGAPEPSLRLVVRTTPSSLHGEHTGCTLKHSTFQIRPRSHAGAHALPASRHKHPHTGPCGPANVVGGRHGVERPLHPHPHHLDKTLHTPGIHTQIIFFTLLTSHMYFTNATHGPGFHILPGPQTCGHKLPTHLGLYLSPGILE